MGNLRNVVYLSEAQYATLLGGGTVGGITLNADDIYLTPTVNPVDGPVTSTATGIATFADTNGNLLTSPSATITPSGIISSAGYKTIDGSVNAPSYTFISAPTTGMFLSSLGELSFTIGAEEKLNISSTGVSVGSGINTWSIADTSSTIMTFTDGNGKTISLTRPNDETTKTIAFAEDVQSAITLTADKVVISDSSGKLAASSVSSTTLTYLDATSSIQTQLNNKLSLSGGTMTGTLINTGPNTALKINQATLNSDINIWRVNGNGGTGDSADYGFNLRYLGTGSGNDNRLSLMADNQTGTQVEALHVHQDGTIEVNKQITLPLATGTSPFNITSTTVNTNLNADLWDGYHFSDYLNQAVKTTSSPTFAGATIGSGTNTWSIDDATLNTLSFKLSSTEIVKFVSGDGVYFGSTKLGVGVANPLVLKIDTGTTEGTDLYTFDGTTAKTLDFKSGTNVTLTDAAGTVTFSSPSLSKGTDSGSGSFVTDVAVSGHQITLSKGNFTETQLSLGTTSGSGNAVTSIAVSNHQITMTKGSTFLTAHPTITMGTDTTSTASPAFGDTFTAIDSVTKDANGHVTLVNTKTVTLPTPSYPTVNNGTLTLGVSGTGLSGSATFTANQSGSSTFTVTSNATNANTASTIVARDSSGNFSAGTITASLTGTASGNLTSSSTLDASKLSGTIPESVLQTEWDTAYSHTSLTNNPHSVTASQVGLGTTATPTFAGLNVGSGTSTWTIEDSVSNKLKFDNVNTTYNVYLDITGIDEDKTIAFKQDVISALIDAEVTNSAIGTTPLTVAAIASTTAPLQIWKVDTSEKMRLTYDGKLGIGTITPSQLLDVQGNIAIAGNKLGGGKNYGSPSNSNDATLEMYNVGTGNTTLNNIGFSIDLQTASTSRLFIKNNGYIGIGTTSPTTPLYVAADANDILTIGNKTNINEQVIFGFNSTGDYGYIQPLEQGVAYRNLILNRDGGRVGVGTASPDSKLSVLDTNKTVDSYGNLFVYTSDSFAQDLGGQISLGGNYTGTTRTRFASISGRKETAVDGNAAGYLVFATANTTGGAVTEKVRITSGGSVGIGTAVPGAKLEVYKAATEKTLIDGSSIVQTSGNTVNPVLSITGTGTADLVNIIDGTTEVFTILDGGYVGINTPTPTSPLMISKHDAGINTLVTLKNNNSSAGTHGVSIALNGYNSIATITASGVPASNYEGTLSFSTNNGSNVMTERLKITGGGAVTISSFTSAGFVKTSSAGLLSVDTNTYLTAHPTITMGTNTTSTASPAFGGTFTAIDSATKDTNGHVTAVNTKTVTLPTPGDGTLSWTTSTAGATNTTIAASLSGAYSANTSTNRTMSLAIGPALTNLATLMTGAGTGIVRKTGADTYETVANTTYLTSYTETDTLSTVTGRGATTATALTITNATASTTTATGALIITGGLGIGGAINSGSTITGTTLTGTTSLVSGTGTQTWQITDSSNNLLFQAGTSPATKATLYSDGALTLTGKLTATSKSFLIDHPTKKGYKLQYGSLEGPETAVYIRGRLKSSNVIELPDYWGELVDESSITVSLTPVGSCQNLFVERIENNTVYNKVYINSNTINIKDIDCFYVVYGERKDIAKLEVEMEDK